VALTSVRVRPVTEDDLPAILELAAELREQLLPVEGGGRGRPSTAGRSGLEDRYRDAVADPTRHVVLAVSGSGANEQVLGMAILSVATTNELLDLSSVHMTHAVVAGRHRKRGAGKALVAAAAAFAEERGIEQLVVSVHPGSREAARFFARLGLRPVAVRRTAPVAVVRRRLSALERLSDAVPRRRTVRTSTLGRTVRTRS